MRPRGVGFERLIHLVPRAGVEPAHPYGQRILSPLREYSPHSTTRYQVVFTDVSAVKASYVWLGTTTYSPHLPLIPRRRHVNQANAMDQNLLGRRERARPASLHKMPVFPDRFGTHAP